MLFLLLLFFSINAFGGEATFIWDANTEEDLAGYKIHYGKTSRLTTSYGFIQKWCDEYEPNNEKCLEEWREICKDSEDQACHSMLFSYDSVIDVKNVTQYTVKNIPLEEEYFYSATAYNIETEESLYSIELSHTLYADPKNPSEVVIISILPVPVPKELHFIDIPGAVIIEHKP